MVNLWLLTEPPNLKSQVHLTLRWWTISTVASTSLTLDHLKKRFGDEIGMYKSVIIELYNIWKDHNISRKTK